jgi:hypothetical protein
MSAVTIARATIDAQAREKAFMSALARDVGRGQERPAAFRVARCQNGDHSVTGAASGIPGRTEQVDLDRLGVGRKIGSTGADSAGATPGEGRSGRQRYSSSCTASAAYSTRSDRNRVLGMSPDHSYIHKDRCLRER